MQTYRDELYHYGVPGMKWGVRKARDRASGFFSRRRTPEKLSVNDSDSATTKRVKNDYNTMSEADFRRRYSASKKRYAKRVAKSATGDPYADRRAKMTKSARGRKRFNKQVEAEAKQMTSVHLAEKADKVGASRSTGSRIATRLLAGRRGNAAYNMARASGSTKLGASMLMGLLGNERTINRSDRKYQNSFEGTKYRKNLESEYYI